MKGHEHYFAQTRIEVMPSYEEAVALLQKRQDERVLTPGKVEPLKAAIIDQQSTTLYSRIEGIY